MKDTSYLTLISEIWGDFYESFLEKNDHDL